MPEKTKIGYYEGIIKDRTNIFQLTCARRKKNARAWCRRGARR